jgi:hypothetical protein
MNEVEGFQAERRSVRAFRCCIRRSRPEGIRRTSSQEPDRLICSTRRACIDCRRVLFDPRHGRYRGIVCQRCALGACPKDQFLLVRRRRGDRISVLRLCFLAKALIERVLRRPYSKPWCVEAEEGPICLRHCSHLKVSLGATNVLRDFSRRLAKIFTRQCRQYLSKPLSR